MRQTSTPDDHETDTKQIVSGIEDVVPWEEQGTMELALKWVLWPYQRLLIHSHAIISYWVNYWAHE